MTFFPAEWHCPLKWRQLPQDGGTVETCFSLTLPAPVLHWGMEYRLGNPFEVTVTAGRTREGIHIEMFLAGQVSIPCSRCLKLSTLALFGNLRYLFLLHSSSESEETEGDAEQEMETVFLDMEKEDVELAPYIWELLIVSLPSVALCRADCAGLCSRCGTDWNEKPCGCSADATDPRLEGLRGFISQNHEDE